jgi:hypothetical protein
VANTLNTEALGIHQADVIIRTALIAAINDMRANPWLLDYVFASLAFDKLTLDQYGKSEIQKAKDWFVKTDIAVVWDVGTNDPKFPCITIGLQSSQEVESEGTLSDTHYEPFQLNNWDWPTLVPALSPLSYVAATGTMAVDPAFVDVVLAPGMVVLTAAGKQYPIVEVIDAGTFKIAAGVVDDFTGMVIKSANPAYITELESAVFREVYTIGCYADSEPLYLTYLHSVVVFALRRYSESLLEARGFERSTISSTDFKREDDALPEFVFSRYVQISGSVRQSWPKTVAMRVSSTLVQASAINDPNDPISVDEDLDVLTPQPQPAATPLFALYHGSAAIPGSLSGLFIAAFTSETKPSRATIANYDSTGEGVYSWFAFPTALGAASENDFIDNETLDDASFVYVGNVLINGASYDVWRSVQANLGVYAVKVLS